MVWREPTNHVSNCYFCMTNIAGFTKNDISAVMFPGCPLDLRPVLHDAENPVPISTTYTNTTSDYSIDEPQGDVEDQEDFL